MKSFLAAVGGGVESRGAAMAALFLYAASAGSVVGADTPVSVPPAKPAAVVKAKAAVPADPKPADPKPVKKKTLTGAELYSINCNRCHQERYPMERTSAQWSTLMLHMRVRANLPADQAKKILRYLQEDSGS
jgi:mono/diheme cytochrome c family protein